MARIDRLRPDLDALLKADPKAAKKEPLPAPEAPPPMTRAERSLDFAEQIAGRHEVEAREGRTRASSLAEKGEQVLLEPKKKAKKTRYE